MEKPLMVWTLSPGVYYAHTFMYICTHIHIYTKLCTHIHIYTHPGTHKHTHMDTHPCTYTHMHACTHTYIHVYTYKHTYIHINKPTCFEKFCNTKFSWCHCSAKKFPSSLNYFPWATISQLRGALYSWDSQPAQLYTPSKPCSWLWIIGKERLMIYFCLSISSSAPYMVCV